MSKARLIIISLAAISIVGGAVWIRIATAPAKNLNLTVLPNGDAGKSALEDSIEKSNAPLIASSSPQSNNTDIIGNQLFGEYMGLVSSNDATPENLNALAARYAEGIYDLNKTAPLTASDIHTIPDSDLNIKSYSTEVLAQYDENQNIVKAEIGKRGGVAFGEAGFEEFSLAMEDLYDKAANELATLPVPQSLTDTHLRLINNYRESADAMRSIANAEKDPIKGYAALNLQAKNTEEAESLLGKIRSSLALGSFSNYTL